jgi:ComF family protein
VCRVLSMLAPERCPVCERPGGAPCAECARTLRPAPPWPAPAGLDACRSAFVYDEPAARLIGALKYRDRRAATAFLADRMAALRTPSAADVITWIPTSGARRRSRGFDQAELLAVAVARRWRVPMLPILRRLPGAPQTGKDARCRREHAGFAVTRSPRGRVVLVDDVLTTGASLSAAARVLREAGANEINGLTAARTPLKVQASDVEHPG